jgi:hypothetical protein
MVSVWFFYCLIFSETNCYNILIKVEQLKPLLLNIHGFLLVFLLPYVYVRIVHAFDCSLTSYRFFSLQDIRGTPVAFGIPGSLYQSFLFLVTVVVDVKIF